MVKREAQLRLGPLPGSSQLHTSPLRSGFIPAPVAPLVSNLLGQPAQIPPPPSTIDPVGDVDMDDPAPAAVTEEEFAETQVDDGLDMGETLDFEGILDELDAFQLGTPTQPAHEVYGTSDLEDPQSQPVPVHNRVPEQPIDDNFIPLVSDLKTALDFKRALEQANLDNGDLSDEHLHLLRHPPHQHGTIDDRDMYLSLKLFISTTLAANQVYNNVRLDVMEVHPEDNLLSHEAVQKTIAKLTGVVPIVHDMCLNSCMAYTGPWTNLERCPFCNTPRYDPTIYVSTRGKKKVSQRRFFTIPIGPVLQAKYRTVEGARNMKYRSRETAQILRELAETNGVIELFNDYLHASEYLEAVGRGDISMDDMVLIFSMDGAQLYQHKTSDCWIYIWIVADLNPELRYKKRDVIPGGFIPGPHPPKHPESFLFPGFHHLAAIQKEGLQIWDAETGRQFLSRPFLYLGAADGPGSVHFTGFVGHHGAYPCRIYCPLKGRHKPGGSHYYPALLKPDNYTVEGCTHDDIHPRDIQNPSSEEYHRNLWYLLNSRNPTDYKERRKDTGISTLSIFHGLPEKHRLPLPLGFPGDVMHVLNLNFGDLLPALWRGTFQCAQSDSTRNWDWAALTPTVWQAHGLAVEKTRQYLPGSYDRPPRNIALKITSGYKAKEWQGYFYGLAPALLYDILPHPYWQNFCHLVQAVRILHQHTITRQQVLHAQMLVEQFHLNFELLYVQRREDRIHIMRPCVHAVTHLPKETVRLGPAPLYSTWTMERMIGDLGAEIRQPSNPFQNLSERGLLRAQLNALLDTFPQLMRQSHDPLHPRGSLDIGNGYILLRAKEEYGKILQGQHGDVIKSYIIQREAALGNVPPAGWKGPKVNKWARLRLPTGQILR
ncbi:hypothetical protein H0H93_008543, partial [Arthromyces matolae]